MNRRWLVEETGETRQAKEGELYLCDGHILQWQMEISSYHTYPILRVTELSSDPPKMGMDEWW